MRSAYLDLFNGVQQYAAMDLHFHLQDTDIADSGRASLSPPPQPVWAEHESDGLIYSLRFLTRDRRPVLSDVRVRPAAAQGQPWEFINDPGTVPGGGLNVTAIHNTGWGPIRDAALHAMSDPAHAVWEQAGFERWEQWYDVVGWTGIDREETVPPTRGGRRPLADEHWAEVALHYVTAIERGSPAHEYIRQQMAQDDKELRLPTGNWVAEARKRGFLTPADRKGRRGGALTKKAREVLIQMGLLPGDTPDKGAEQ